MKLQSPLSAMLWELWRVTRTELAWKLLLPLGIGMVSLILCAAFAPADNPQRHDSIMNAGALAALILLVAPNFLGWISLATLNGGRPGFPLHLLYTRPVRTAALVAVPMLYLSILPAAIYLGSALVLGWIFSISFPLLPVAAWIVLLNVILRAVYWSSRSMATLTLSTVVVFAVWTRLARHRLDFEYHDPPDLWPTLFGFSLTDAALMTLIGFACFGVTAIRVAQQRRGDAQVAVPLISGGRLRAWLIELFRLPCPTGSAARAQVWYDLKSNGLPLLAIATALAVMILLLFAISNPIDNLLHDEFHFTCEKVREQRCFVVRGWAMFFAMLSPVIMLGIGGNIFGISWRKGRISTFDAIQPCGTARFTWLRILTSVVCILCAIAIVQVSAWISIAAFGAETFKQVTNIPLGRFQGAFKGLEVHEWLALAFLLFMLVCSWVAVRAALGAIWVRHSRGMAIAAVLLFFVSLAMVLLAFAEHRGAVSASMAGTMFAALGWSSLAAFVSLVVYLFWKGFADRVLTPAYLCVAMVTAMVFGVAWLTVWHLTGEELSGKSAMSAVAAMSPSLLPLILGLLAPWSLNRIRHM